MPLRFVRQLRNNTAQPDGTTIKLGAHILAALRLVFRLRINLVPPFLLRLRYLDEERERHGLNQNPVYIGVHGFEASRA